MVKRKPKIILSLLVFCVCFSQYIYADITRGEVVDFSLNYHELKTIDEAREKIRQEESLRLQESVKEERQKKWQARTKKVKDFLDKFKYSIANTFVYNDNVSTVETDPKSESYSSTVLKTSYRPQLSWKKRKKTDVFFDYKGDGVSLYSSEKDMSKSNLGKVGFMYRITPKYNLAFDYSAKNVHTVNLDSTEPDGIVAIDSMVYDYGGKFIADWGKLPCEFEFKRRYTSAEKKYHEDNSIVDNYAFTSQWRISGKTSLFGEYTYQKNDNIKIVTGDSYTTGYGVGVRGKISPKIVGEAKLNWGTVEYDDNIEQDIESMGFDLDYDLTRRFTLNLLGSKSLSAGTYEDTDASQTNTVGVGFRYFPPFNSKLSLNGKVTKVNSEFEDSNRSDDVVSLGLGAKYNFNKIINLGFDYDRKERESNASGKNYTQNILSIVGEVVF